MQSTLRILLIGLLFYSGHGTPIDPGSEDYPHDGEDLAKPKSKSPPIIVTPPENIIAVPGNDLELPCVVENNEEEDAILWTHNNMTIFVDFRLISSNKDNFAISDKKFLIIKKFSPELSGAYTCQVGTKNGSHITHIVGIKEPPTVEYINGKKYVDSASDLNLLCKVKGFPSPIITWYIQKNDSSSKHQLDIFGESLNIRSVTFNDSGIYICQASNGETQDSKTYPVTVINGIAPESSVVHALEAKNSTKLCCVFDKDREIMWLKDGKPLDLSNDRYVKDKVKHKSCLVIKTAKIEDIGVYTCQSQKANDLPERADIKLIGTPSKPVLKQIATDADKNPILNWEVFSLVPLTSLKFFYKKPEENDWKALPEKMLQPNETISHVFSDLPNGKYDVKLVVSNQFGSSESIENSAVVVDRIEPNVVISAKIGSGAARSADSQYKITAWCIMFATLVRLWSC